VNDINEDPQFLQEPQPRNFQLPVLGETIRIRGHTYYIGDEINKGGFATVYACSDEWSNHLVAKILLPKGQVFEEVQLSWAEEIHKLLNFRHPNITYMYDAFVHNDAFYIILERCSSTLEELINFPDLNGDIWIPHVARDSLQGLKFIHDMDFVHKDMHPGNVFVSKSIDRMVPSKPPVWSFKIGDFGISRLEGDIGSANT
jgi:serine/threonine protein kinase